MGKRWGTLEIAFEPIYGKGFWAWVKHPIIGTMCFVGVFCLIVYQIYLRRTLRFLNPQSVIPERIQALLNTLTESVVVLDHNERIVLANSAFAKLVCAKSDQLQGKLLSTMNWTLLDEKPDHKEYPWSTAIRNTDSIIGIPLTLLRKVDGSRTLMVNAAPVLGGDGSTRGALVTFDDVTAIEMKNVQLNDVVAMLKESRDKISKQNDQLQLLATRDPLTGCLNRRSLFEQFNLLWGVSEKNDTDIGCIMFDIDKFKSINDTHGHAVGDQVLRENRRSTQVYRRRDGSCLSLRWRRILYPHTTYHR